MGTLDLNPGFILNKRFVGSSYPANYGDNDFRRMKTQRAFITETIKQSISIKNIFKSKAIIDTIFENLETTYKNGNNLEARKNMLEASHLAGLAFSRSYVGYVHAIAHSLGRKYGIAHAQSNAVILPTMLRFYGKKIHKKLWKVAVYCNMVNKNMPYEDGAKVVIEKIEKMNRNLKIKSNLSCIKEEDIPQLAKVAAKEANPLYPVPVLYSSKNLEKVLHILKIKV